MWTTKNSVNSKFGWQHIEVNKVINDE